MATRPLGVGIIGLSARGGWASTAHVPAIAAVNGVELRALSASTPDSTIAAASRYGVRGHGDARGVAADPAVDLLVITVKVSEHRQLIEAALEAGKPVLCEWPLATTAEESSRLGDLARAAGVRTFVGLQARATPLMRHIRDLVADGYVGQVLSTTVVADGMSWGSETRPSKTYLFDRTEGASMLAIPVGHTLDAMEFVLDRFASVQATTAIRRPCVDVVGTERRHRKTVADQIAVQGTMRDGIVVATHFRGGRSAGPSFRWEINGDEGDLLVTGDQGAFVEYGQLQLYGARSSDASLQRLPTPVGYVDVESIDESDLAFTVAQAYAQIVSDLRDDGATTPDFDHATRLHRLLETIEESAASGRSLTT